jgi:hypothetical protein
VQVGKWVVEEMEKVARAVELMGEKVQWERDLAKGKEEGEKRREEAMRENERDEGEEKDESFYDNLKDYIMFSNYKNYRGQKFNS